MAQFSTKTAFPLAAFFIGTSGVALILCYAAGFIKNTKKVNFLNTLIKR